MERRLEGDVMEGKQSHFRAFSHSNTHVNQRGHDQRILFSLHEISYLPRPFSVLAIMLLLA
jgi:hypothetical protein